MTGDGPAAAVAALSATLGADPGRGDLWSELATALVAAGRAREGWDAAVRAVQLEPRSPASHRAIGAAAAALDDARQAESAYRHALLLDPADHATRTALARLPLPAPRPAPTDPPTSGGRRRAPEPEPPTSGGRRRAPEPDPLLDPLDPPASGGRRRAPEPDPPLDPPTSAGRRRAPDPEPPTSGGRRRAPEHDPLLDPLPSGRRRAPEPDPYPGPPSQGGRRRAPEPPGAPPIGGPPNGAPLRGVPLNGAPPVTPAAVGPARLAPAPYQSQPPPPVGATRVAPVGGTWRRALITVVRIEWLVAVACYVGLAFARVAPYTAGALAGLAVVLGGYGRLRWQTAPVRRPPRADRPATTFAVAAAVAAVVVVPAAMFGALTVARAAAIAAATCATAAAVLLRGRP